MRLAERAVEVRIIAVIFTLKLQGFFQGLDRRLVILELVIRQSYEFPTVGMIRSLLQHLPEFGDRFAELALFV